MTARWIVPAGFACAAGVLVLAAVDAPGGASAFARPVHTLAGVERRVLLDPFPSTRTRRRLQAALSKLDAARALELLLPPGARPSHALNESMGWAGPDAGYWRAIPLPARVIPSSWSRLPVVRFTNAELGGTREVRLRTGPVYDQWLLEDPLHDLTACVSVDRTTRRVYFMEIGRGADGRWAFRPSHDNCYSCHPSGPRVIRPLDPRGVDIATLRRFNARILGYGACDFGATVDTSSRGAPYTDARCTGCHNGVWRGRLYAINTRPIRFKTERERSMPPHA